MQMMCALLIFQTPELHGRLSYSVVRAITRMDRHDEGVDQALVELATSGSATILDLEWVVRSYMLYAALPPEPCGGVFSGRLRHHRGGARRRGQPVRAQSRRVHGPGQRGHVLCSSAQYQLRDVLDGPTVGRRSVKAPVRRAKPHLVRLFADSR